MSVNDCKLLNVFIALKPEGLMQYMTRLPDEYLDSIPGFVIGSKSDREVDGYPAPLIDITISRSTQ